MISRSAFGGDIHKRSESGSAWAAAHVEHFDDLQDAYSDRLATAAARLRLSFGCEQINLTLWLADGSGSLARWATQDRHDRDCAGLRKVRTGHDSRWIAGKALGSEATLFQDLHGEPTGRWRSVLALPIAVTLGPWPQFVTAVLSVGLPEPAHAYERTALLWGEELRIFADFWSVQLARATNRRTRMKPGGPHGNEQRE